MGFQKQANSALELFSLLTALNEYFPDEVCAGISVAVARVDVNKKTKDLKIKTICGHYDDLESDDWDPRPYRCSKCDQPFFNTYYRVTVFAIGVWGQWDAFLCPKCFKGFRKRVKRVARDWLNNTFLINAAINRLLSER